MQLDRTRIAIRERSYPDILDLALRVVRTHFAPLSATFAMGAAPMLLLNNWLLGLLDLADVDYEFQAPGWYLFWCGVLIVLEIPLAAVPTTLYLGQVLFHDEPDSKRAWKDFVRSLPQLILLQVLVRAAAVLSVFGLFWLYAGRPYLNEIILLERNPLFTKQKGAMTTWRRASRVHTSSIGELFARWMVALAVGGVWIGMIWVTIWLLRGIFTSQADFGRSMYTIHLQAAVWAVASFFAVVRFLSYLDLRIRTEGWEVELMMRAEAARLSRQIV